MSIRIGISQWNYISDIEKDTPGGSNFYFPSMILEMEKRSWKVHSLQENRDLIRSTQLNHKIPFGYNFIPKEREKCYNLLFKEPYEKFPELDILFLEWRWEIPGRNTDLDINSPGFTPDYRRQMELLLHYHDTTNTTIVISDLDHHLSVEDEKRWSRCHIFEPSIKPKNQLIDRVSAFLPFDTEIIPQFIKYYKDNNQSVSYIGNNYERSEAINQFIKPVSDMFPGEVSFIGNWFKYSVEFEKIKAAWPNIYYKDRITKEDFVYVYGPALTCPILAKKSYYESGFISPRILESLLYGCIPVGFSCHTGINKFIHSDFIVKDSNEYIKLIKNLKNLSISEYNNELRKMYDYLDLYSPKDYVNKLEACLGKRPQKVV